MRKAISRNYQSKPHSDELSAKVEMPQSLTYRHIEVFRHVYQERDYASAGFGLGSTGRSVKKSLKDIQNILGVELFTEGCDGEAIPTPFAERLFTDTKGLDSAMNLLIEKAEFIREQGRVLRVGATPAIFRTTLFRAAYRELQAMEGFRIRYVQLSQEVASKALLRSCCDLYLGFDDEEGERFVSEKIAMIPLKEYVRGENSRDFRHSVHSPKLSLPCGKSKQEKLPKNIILIPEERWMHWLDHPADCEEGTFVRAPEMSLDSKFWTETKLDAGGCGQLSLQAIFLKQHPFEFLPKIAGRLRKSIQGHVEA